MLHTGVHLGTGAARSVAQMRRDLELALLAHAHAVQALVPALVVVVVAGDSKSVHAKPNADASSGTLMTCPQK